MSFFIHLLPLYTYHGFTYSRASTSEDPASFM